MDEIRQRLLDALASEIEERGWDQVTTAGVARRARTSKRAYYECFPRKIDGFLALYEVEAAKIAERVLLAIHDASPGPERIRLGMRAYLSALSERPGLARDMLLEVARLGPQGMALRRRVLGRFAELIGPEVVAMGRLPPEQAGVLARLLVGGISELVLEAVEAGGVEAIAELEDDVVGVLATLAERSGAETA